MAISAGTYQFVSMLDYASVISAVSPTRGADVTDWGAGNEDNLQKFDVTITAGKCLLTVCKSGLALEYQPAPSIGDVCMNNADPTNNNHTCLGNNGSHTRQSQRTRASSSRPSWAGQRRLAAMVRSSRVLRQSCIRSGVAATRGRMTRRTTGRAAIRRASSMPSLVSGDYGATTARGRRSPPHPSMTDSGTLPDLTRWFRAR